MEYTEEDGFVEFKEGVNEEGTQFLDSLDHIESLEIKKSV